MATVTNWIDHLNKPAEEVAGSVYPGAGSSEFILVLLLIAVWIGWSLSLIHISEPTRPY